MSKNLSPRGASLARRLWPALLLACFACAADTALPEDDAPTLRAESGERARTGSFVAKATLASSPTWTKLIHHDRNVTRQTSYTASIWVRGQGKLRLDIVNAAWRGNLASVSITAGPTWQQFKVPTFSSGDNDVVHFSLYDAVGGASGEVYFDDAFLGTVGGANLLGNPSFEAGNASWLPEGVFSIVKLGAGTGASADAPTSSGGGARTGSGYAQVALKASPSWTKLNHYDRQVAKNRVYTASIWARGQGTLRFDVVNKPWKANLASVVIEATPTWRQYQVPAFDTGDNDVVHFSLYDAVGDGPGTVYFDDAFLGLSGGPNLLANPSFEQGKDYWLPDGPFSVVAGSGTTPVVPPIDVPTPPKPDPSNTTFAEVEANGTGCPANTWITRISSDGLVFTTTFSAYEVRLDPNMTLSVKDCQLAIRLHTPQGRSFSVLQFSYSGYANIRKGVTARQLASYSFQGQAVQSKAARTDLTGPYDDDFVFRDNVDIEDAVWSPCGVERDLNITTRILLESQTPGPSGYMNLTAADGSAQLILRLASRSCTEFGSLQ